MIAWPESLIKDLALRRCILVLGAGVSCNSVGKDNKRPKNWLGLLREMSSSLQPKDQKNIDKLLKQNDLLTACEMIKRVMGKEPFSDKLRAEFLLPEFKAAPIHEVIFKLDARIVVTPNFDLIYDTYVKNLSSGSTISKTHTDPDLAESLRAHDRLIIKMHGTIDKTSELIFTRKDYAEARSKYASFYSIVDALIVTNTFLFIGCGTSDPDIRMLLENYRYRFGVSRKHFFTTPKGENTRAVNEILQDTLNINFLEYSPDNNHEDLLKSLEEFEVKIAKKRKEIADQYAW